MMVRACYSWLDGPLLCMLVGLRHASKVGHMPVGPACPSIEIEDEIEDDALATEIVYSF